MIAAGHVQVARKYNLWNPELPCVIGGIPIRAMLVVPSSGSMELPGGSHLAYQPENLRALTSDRWTTIDSRFLECTSQCITPTTPESSVIPAVNGIDMVDIHMNMILNERLQRVITERQRDIRLNQAAFDQTPPSKYRYLSFLSNGQGRSTVS